MATRVPPTAHDADNNVGTDCGAARNDWRSADADSMSARDTTIPPQMPDIRLQATTRPAFKPDCLSYLREESIYALLASVRPIYLLQQFEHACFSYSTLVKRC